MDTITPDDLEYYSKVINRRKARHYISLLAIQHNPHSDNPEELFERLQHESGDSFLYETEPDRAAITDLQGLISPNMQK